MRTDKMNFKIIFIFLCSLVLNCTSLTVYKMKPKAKSASANKIKDFSKIQKRGRKETLNDTIKKLNQFIANNKDNDLALSAHIYMARLYYKYRKKEKACETYYRAVKLPFTYTNQNQAVYAAAKCLKISGKIKEALNFLESRLRFPQETITNKKKMAFLQWKFVKNKSNFKEWKLKILSHLVHFNPRLKKIDTYKQQAHAILKSFSASELIDLVETAHFYRSFESRILFLAGEIKWKQKEFLRSQSYFKKALAATSDPTIEQAIQYYLKILKAQDRVNSKRIGVILPLSGKRKRLGQKILRGLQAGLGLTQNSPYQLIIIDSKNHSDVTRNAVEKLLHTQHVVGIVGGLSGETATAIADTATNLGVPSILFSQKAELTTNRRFIFQNAITSKAITQNLVRTLFKKTAMKNFAILYPKDSYGKEYKDLFIGEVEKYQGTIVASESYAPNETDFKNSIKKLIGIYSVKERQEEYEKLKKDYLEKNPGVRSRAKKLRPENLLKPIIEFDGIFIPDSIKTLKKIIAHLKYFGVKDMNLIGNNLWKSSDIKRWSKDFSFFYINTPNLSKEEKRSSPFYTIYKDRFRSPPGFFERQAYNTGVALKIALDRGVKNRLDLQKNLKDIRGASGAFFNFKINENHIFVYPLAVYSTKKSKTFLLDSIPVN